MKRTLNHIAIAVAATALSGAVFAGGDKHKDTMAAELKTPSFYQLDANNDGAVSKTEIQSADDRLVSETLTEKWSELDTNQDGSLDQAEFARFEPVTPSEKDHGMEDPEDY